MTPGSPNPTDMARLYSRWVSLAPIVRRLAWRFVERARRAGYEPADLESAAFLHFLKVAETYDPARGIPEPGYFSVVFSRLFTSLTRQRTLRLIPDLDHVAVARPAEPVNWLEEFLDRLARQHPEKAVKVRAFRGRYLEGKTLTALKSEFERSVPTLSRWVSEICNDLDAARLADAPQSRAA